MGAASYYFPLICLMVANRCCIMKWSIVHASLHGVTRDQFISRHKASHINIVYAPNAEQSKGTLVMLESGEQRECLLRLDIDAKSQEEDK